MKLRYLILLFITLFVCIKNSSAQNNNYLDPIPDNGYTWISLYQPLSISTSSRYNYLATLLNNHRFKKLENSNYSFIDCEEDLVTLDELQPVGKSIDLNDIREMIDKFYESKDNLVIPILGAYCYNIKKLAGYTEEALEAYRQELFELTAEHSRNKK